MKNTLIHITSFSIVLLLMINSILIAQNVGIGETTFTPDANAMLEVQSDNKGFLPPRVELIETTNFAPLSAHVEGMVVYNTASANDVTPGLYVNDGAKWIRLEPQTYSAGSGININNNVISTNSVTTTSINNYTTTITGNVLNNSSVYCSTGRFTGLTADYIESGDIIIVRFSVNILHTTYPGSCSCTNQYKYIDIQLPVEALNTNSIINYGGGFTVNNGSWGTPASNYLPTLISTTTLRISAHGTGNLLHYSNCSSDGSWTFSPWITYIKQ